MNDRSPRQLDMATGEMDLKIAQAQFVEWLCGDRPQGESQNQFAARIGVHPGTLSKWKKDELFCRQWEKRMRETHASPEKQNQLLEKLFESANRTGDPKAIAEYFRLIDKMTPQKIEIDDKRSLAEMSDAELAEMAAELDNVEFLRG